MVDVSVDEAVHGVAHQHGWVGGIEDDQCPSALSSADGLQRGGGGLGEFVDAGTGSGAGGFRRDRRDDLGIGHDAHLSNRGDDGHGRLSATGHHVEVRGVEVVIEVDYRHAVGPDGGRGQVEDAHSGVLEFGPVRPVCACGGGIEDELDIAEVRHRKQTVDSLGRDRNPHPLGSGEPVGVRVDADHRRHGQRAVTSQDFDHQVGADVARADDGDRPLVLC